MRDENGIEILGGNIIIPAPGTLPAIVCTENGISIASVGDSKPFRVCRRNVQRAIKCTDGSALLVDISPDFVQRVDFIYGKTPNLLLYS